MEYYKVKKYVDNLKNCKLNVLVENELFTKREMEKYNVPEKYVELINVPKNSVYWFFGCRFNN